MSDFEDDDKSIKDILNELKETQLKKEDVKITVNECLGPLTARLTAVETLAGSNKSEIDEVNREVSNLQNTVSGLSASFDAMERKIERYRELCDSLVETGLDALDSANRNEQYTRKSSILIFNLKTDPSTTGPPGRESMSLCRDIVSAMLYELLRLEIPAGRISVAHRLPKSKNPSAADQPPPMYARFIRLEDKNAVMRAVKEKNLNADKTKPTIKHDLTMKNKELLDRIFKHPKFSHGWYFNGNIYASTIDDYRIGPINITSDLDAVFLERAIVGNIIRTKTAAKSLADEQQKGQSTTKPQLVTARSTADENDDIIYDAITRRKSIPSFGDFDGFESDRLFSDIGRGRGYGPGYGSPRGRGVRTDSVSYSSPRGRARTLPGNGRAKSVPMERQEPRRSNRTRIGKK